jgi:ATP-binding cassette subfamily B protein
MKPGTHREFARTLSSTLARIFAAFRPHILAQRSRLILGAVSILLATLLDLMEPWPLKFIYDHIFLGKSGRHLTAFHGLETLDSRLLLGVLSLSFITISILGALADYVSTLVLSLAASKIITEVRDRVFLHLEKMPLSFHSRHKTGDLITRVIFDTDRLREVIVTAILPFLTTLLTLVAMVAVMLCMNWKLALIAVLSFPAFVGAVVRMTRRLKEGAQQQRLREGALATATTEVLGSIPVVQALSLQKTFARVFAAANQESLRQSTRVQRLSAGLERTVEVFAAAGTAIAVWFGAQMVLSKTITPGYLIVFIAYLRMAFKPMRQLAKYAGQIVKAVASGDRIVDVLEHRSEVEERPGAIDAVGLRGAIRLENAWFEYEPGIPVLREINLSIEPGQHIAIVGPSGSGKSTLASLLLRFYDPTQGQILFDGRNIRKYKLDSLRSQMGAVLQDNCLFAASVRDNIRFGWEEASEEDIVRAARLTNAHEFIEELPQGYDTILGERGATLSGGQRRRLVLARAAVRQAPILILDEPTTGLDGRNESEVHAALSQLSEGRTTILISHDLAAVIDADRILYLSEGRIVEEGTHEELVALGGQYAYTYRLQSVETGMPARRYAEA